MILLGELVSLYESAPTPHRMDSTFNVANVSFDNNDGMGATPMGGNVIYRGAVAWIRPSIFRRLAADADRSDTAKQLQAEMKAGKAIAAPFLIIDVLGEPDAPENVIVKSHEGRARADAFAAINGDIHMPVQLHPIGLRARDLSIEFFRWIEQNGMKAERTHLKVLPLAKMYYWQDREVRV